MDASLDGSLEKGTVLWLFNKNVGTWSVTVSLAKLSGSLTGSDIVSYETYIDGRWVKVSYICWLESNNHRESAGG